MEHALFYLAIATLVFFAAFGIDLMVGSRSIRFLKDIPSLATPCSPRVSIIVAARNEERNIREALQSVLNQDYGSTEVIVIDDRSTDGTRAILDSMARANPRLRVLHLTDLPPGWLGKNHALHNGAQQATGDLFLFTDADVVMHPSAVRKAVGYLVAHQLDHLTITPEVRTPGILTEMFAGPLPSSFRCMPGPGRPKTRRARGPSGSEDSTWSGQPCIVPWGHIELLQCARTMI